MEALKNTEFVQSLIRLSIGLLTYAYISSGISSGYFDTAPETLQIFSLTFFTFTFAIMASLYWVPVSTPRRYLALFADIASATFSSYLTGGINSVYVLVYLWIYIGYGTRYGKRYLLAAMAMTFIGYNILILTENAWSMLTLDAIAFLLLIVALPLYLYSLQKRLQDAVTETEQANRAKTEFLSTMTHQIRTPIGGVVGMIDLLNKTSLDAQQKQYLQALSQSSNALQEIVEDIVDFSRIDQGEIAFDDKSIQPRTMLNSLVHSLAPLAHEKRLELNCYIDDSFPHYIFGDAQRLRQLLSNSIRHAIDSCDSGEISIQASARNGHDDNNVHAVIEIDFSHQQPVTEQAEFGDDALALRVGSQLTRLMGGHFEIQNPKPGKTRFLLEFTWQIDDHSPTPASLNFKNRRVLIFEPDDTSRNNLEKQLLHFGITTYAADGHDNLIAHILWSREKDLDFDAIVLCETLKTHNVSELVQRIRNKAECPAPIIYATYIHNIERTDAGAMPDVQATIVKPFDQNLLAHTLNQLFKNAEETTSILDADSERRFRILLAEDSEINASIIYSHLTDLGHNVDVATDGNTALYAMHKHHYDIVFMDLHMPNLDGIEATRKWRSIEPSKTKLPVIAITAKATSEDKHACMEAGMDGFLTKPVTANQLAEVLNQHL